MRRVVWSLRPGVVVVLLGLLSLLATGLPGASAQAASPPPVSSVSDKLMCLCGCNSILTQCPHQNCEWGIPAKERIKQELAAGKKPNVIVKEFVDQYGERVLAAPTKSGFNLLAWVIPFVVLIGGAIGLYFVVAGWTKRRNQAAFATPGGQIEQPDDEAPDELVKKMEDELKDFD